MLIYTNAADVLPPDLLAAVQKHWNGFLYVSPVKQPKKLTEEENAVLLAIQSGCTAQDVAIAYNISIWKVYRLARQLGSLNPYADQARRQGGRPRRCTAEK